MNDEMKISDKDIIEMKKLLSISKRIFLCIEQLEKNHQIYLPFQYEVKVRFKTIEMAIDKKLRELGKIND